MVGFIAREPGKSVANRQKSHYVAISGEQFTYSAEALYFPQNG
jgi:hypothetical protein